MPLDSSTSSSSNRFAMHGIFPVLEGNVLADVQEAINAFRGASDFVRVDGGAYVAFDYRKVTADTFPDPDGFPKREARLRWLAAVRREVRICGRGIGLGVAGSGITVV